MVMYNTPHFKANKMLITIPNTDNLDLVMGNFSRILQQEIENCCNLREDGKILNKFSAFKSSRFRQKYRQTTS